MAETFRIGILVGHHGRGTGAAYGNRDEYLLAMSDAFVLHQVLAADSARVTPYLISIDREQHPWDLVAQVMRMGGWAGLSEWRNIALRVRWALREQVDLAVELHYNSARFNDSIQGHELYIARGVAVKGAIDRAVRLADCVAAELNARLPNRDRGVKRKNYRVLRKLNGAGVPALLLEPAFIWEQGIVRASWRQAYCEAIRDGLYKYLGI